jgi:peptide/nickel transport system substrate-binding protein
MRRTDSLRLLLLCALLPIALGCREARTSADLVSSSDGVPQYGGTVNIGTYYVTLSALSWDPADWNWKLNHDTGAFYEQLWAGDLDKSVRKGGKYAFRADAWLPADAIRGELAETWEWETPLRLAVHLRRGVMFPDKPGVMKSRELTADDVVFTFDRSDQSPKKIPSYYDHLDRVFARDEHTVVFEFNEFNAEWDYRFGYGYYSPITPREIGEVDAKDWRNVVGTGPFQLTRYVQGNSQVYDRNPDYWDRETVNGESYEIPFVDRIVYRTIKDEATWLTALRTAKLDIMETVRWIAVDHLKETTPELQWARWLSFNGTFLALRVDEQPFGDVRVRRALNLAVNQPEIVSLFYGGHAELLGYPMHPEYLGYYQPLEEMPDSVRELYTYDPEGARRLLAEAGFADGFSFTGQVCACNPSHMELMQLLASYLAEVGVEMEIQPLEYGAYLSAMTTRTHAPGYLLASGHVNPTTSLRKNFVTGQTWNPAQFSDPEIDERIWSLFTTREEETRRQEVQDLTVEILDQAPYIWLPTPYIHTAWWPWVKGYQGELRAGAVRPWPIYARLWIDHELKRRLGF